MKIFLFKIISVFFVLLVGCSPFGNLPTSTKVSNADLKLEKKETIESDTKDFNKSYSDLASDNLQDWQKAYLLFLREFVILQDFKICLYAIRDINLDKVPELILLQTDMSVEALLEIYSFKDGIFKTGEYTEYKVASAICISDNPLYPGLFTLRWGGGVEHYGYITVDDDLLVYEYLWFNNLAPEDVAKVNGQPGKNIISDNKELIVLSENIFSDVNENNMLEMFILGEDDFESILKSY